MTKFYYEKVNREICDKLILMTYTQWAEIFSKSSTKRHDDYDIKKEYKKIIDYCNKQKENNYNLKVNYWQPTRLNDEKIGRFQAIGPGMQRIYNGIRGALMKDITIDIDMTLAHYSILYKLCYEHRINCPNVYKYINNRQEIIEDFERTDKLNKAEVKHIFLKALNKDELILKYNDKNIKNKFFLELNKEILLIQKELINKLPHYKDIMIDNDKDYNETGTILNAILCDNENKILQKALKYIKDETDYNISVLMFDGFMIETKDTLINKEEIINKLNEITKDDYIRWDIKEHNTELLEIINNMEFKKVDSYLGTDIIDTVNYILNGLLKDKLYKCENELYLITDEKIESNKDIIESYLYNLISENEYHYGPLEDEKGRPKTIASKYHKTINEIVKSIIHKCPTNNKFLNDIWNETRGKIYFKNGYYDFEKNEFKEGRYNKSFIKIDYDYNNQILNNQSSIDEVYDKLLNPIFSIHKDNSEEVNKINEQLRDNCLYRLSRMLACKLEDKNWILLEGMRNCGKGALCDALKNSFQKYVKTTNAENFIYKKTSTDSAKALSWMLDFRFCRLATINEASIKDDNDNDIIYDGVKFKKFSSGGDYIESRKNHKDEIEFKIQAGLLFCCNDLPKITPKDSIDKFMIEYQLKSVFQEKECKDPKIEGYCYYETDPNFKEKFLSKPEIISAFTYILINAYNNKIDYPKEIKMKLDENKDDNDYTALFNLFQITSNKEDIIKNKELEAHLKNNNIPFSIKKVRPLLITKGAKAYRTATHKGLSNIKLIVDEN